MMTARKRCGQREIPTDFSWLFGAPAVAFAALRSRFCAALSFISCLDHSDSGDEALPVTIAHYE